MVESKIAVQIALTFFVLTLRAVYGYVWILFFFEKWKYSGGRYLYFCSDFFFFLGGGGGVQFRTCPFILSVESENTG